MIEFLQRNEYEIPIRVEIVEGLYVMLEQKYVSYTRRIKNAKDFLILLQKGRACWIRETCCPFAEGGMITTLRRQPPSNDLLFD